MSELQTVTPAALAIQQPTIEQILMHAVERGQVDIAEKLMAMRERLKAEQAREAYNDALAAFQKECPVIQKWKPVFGKQDKQNAKYYFAPLDTIIMQVRDLLQKHGFSFSFDTEVDDKQGVNAICWATHSRGHSRSSKFRVQIEKSEFMSLAQSCGSALSFAKRYAFCNAFGITVGDEDDDARKPVPNPKPPADPNAPAAQTRTERHEAATMKERVAALWKAWHAKNHGKGMTDFNAWCQATLKSGDAYVTEGKYLALAVWSELDMEICEKAVANV